MRALPAAAALALLAGSLPAWSASITASAEAEELALTAGSRRLSARLSERGLEGPRVRLRWLESGIRGEVEGAPVRLSWRRALITGRLGESRVRLQVSQKEQGEDIEGSIGGEPSDLTLMPTRIEGTVGGCRYALALAGDQYDGWRDCNGTEVPVAVSLRLPARMLALRDVERAAVLVPLLASAGPPPP